MDVGCLVDEKVVNWVLVWIEEVVVLGVKLICGGKKIGVFIEFIVLLNFFK